MSGDEAAVHPGDILAGKYRVERELGRGGFRVVILATELERSEPRAIKLLVKAARSHKSTVERFSREAQALSRLTSEHTVRILDVGTLEDGAPYMVMEYLDGTDLSAMVKRRGALPAH